MIGWYQVKAKNLPVELPCNNSCSETKLLFRMLLSNLSVSHYVIYLFIVTLKQTHTNNIKTFKNIYGIDKVR